MLFKMIENMRKKREQKEIKRLEALLVSETDEQVIRDIESQILYVECLSWRDYKMSRKMLGWK